jgi:hypothetical protein
VGLLRSLAPNAILLGADHGLCEGHAEGEGLAAPLRCCSQSVATGPSVRPGDIVGGRPDCTLQRTDVSRASGSSVARRVGIRRPDHISDRLIADTPPNTVPSRLRAIAARRGVPLNRLERAAAKVLLDEAHMVRAAAVPVVDDDIARSGVVN